jgi:multidrug efflux pump
MTTAAMVVGMLPLVVAAGAGARSRAAIGIVIAAGMSVGTLFTLFVTPAVYSLIARDHRDEGAKEGAGQKRSARPRGPAPSLAPAHAEADATVG